MASNIWKGESCAVGKLAGSITDLLMVSETCGELPDINPLSLSAFLKVFFGPKY
jgi:hypothetical protein